MTPSPKKPGRGRPRKATLSPAPESESTRRLRNSSMEPQTGGGPASDILTTRARTRRTGATVSSAPEAVLPTPKKPTTRAMGQADYPSTLPKSSVKKTPARSPAKTPERSLAKAPAKSPVKKTSPVKRTPAKANETKKKVKNTPTKVTKPTITPAKKSPTKKKVPFHETWLESVHDGSGSPEEINDLLNKYSEDLKGIVDAYVEGDLEVEATHRKVFEEAKTIKTTIDDIVQNQTFETEPFSKSEYRRFTRLLSQCQGAITATKRAGGTSVKAVHGAPPIPSLPSTPASPSPAPSPSPKQKKPATKELAEGPFICEWNSDTCGHECETRYQLKTHILKHPLEQAEVYTCSWGKNSKCLFTSITPLTMKNHIWRDHLDHEDRPYVGSVDEKWVKKQPPFKKLAAEWKAKGVPEHMHKGDTRVSPLSGEEWWADVPPYYLAGDTPFTDQVVSDQMTLDLLNGKRQLKSQPDITEKQLEKHLDTVRQTSSATSRPTTSGGGSGNFITDTISSTISGAVNTIGSLIRPSPGSTPSQASASWFWEKQKQSWKLPTPDKELLARATEVAKRAEVDVAGAANKRKASHDSHGGQSGGKRRRVE